MGAILNEKAYIMKIVLNDLWFKWTFWLNNLSTIIQLNEYKKYVVDKCNYIWD